METRNCFALYVCVVWLLYELVKPGLNRFVALLVSMLAAYWLSLPLTLYYKYKTRSRQW